MFRSRKSVLQAVLQNGKYSEKDVAKLRLGFLQDGWIETDLLPQGWMMKRERKSHSTYLSADNQLFNSQREVITHMRRNKFSQEDIKNIYYINKKLPA